MDRRGKSTALMLILAGMVSLPAEGAAQSPYVLEYTFGSFISARSLAAGQEEILVVDADANTLGRYAPDGTTVSRIGGRGWGRLEFDQPTDVCAGFPLDVFVADHGNRRIQRFDRTMNFVESLTENDIDPGTSGSFFPRACALSRQGELFVLEADGKRILKFTSRMVFDREFGSFDAGRGALRLPVDITCTGDDAVLVLDGQRVVQYDVFGNYVGESPVTAPDSALAISAFSGGFLVACRGTIVLFRPDRAVSDTIGRDKLIGLDPRAAIRDALMWREQLFVLTDHFVAVFRRAGP